MNLWNNLDKPNYVIKSLKLDYLSKITNSKSKIFYSSKKLNLY